MLNRTGYLPWTKTCLFSICVAFWIPIFNSVWCRTFELFCWGINGVWSKACHDQWAGGFKFHPWNMVEMVKQIPAVDPFIESAIKNDLKGIFFIIISHIISQLKREIEKKTPLCSTKTAHPFDCGGGQRTGQKKNEHVQIKIKLKFVPMSKIWAFQKVFFIKIDGAVHWHMNKIFVWMKSSRPLEYFIISANSAFLRRIRYDCQCYFLHDFFPRSANTRLRYVYIGPILSDGACIFRLEVRNWNMWTMLQ